MTFADLKKRVAFLAQDPAMSLMLNDDYGEFINDAVRDLTMAGWLTPLDADTSLTMAANTYAYDVPANFAYVYTLRMQTSAAASTYDEVVPPHQYRIRMMATATPQFVMESGLWFPRAGEGFMVVGQRRPATYTLDADVIEAQFEAFLRERAVAMALYFAAGLPQPHAADYVQEVESDSPTTRRGPDVQGLAGERIKVLLALANLRYMTSEKMLSYHPMEFRVKPSSQHVPGR